MNYQQDPARGLWGLTFPKQISAAGPWKTMESPPPVAQVLGTGAREVSMSQEVSMSPLVPKVRIKWHLRRQGHWKGQKERIGGAGVKWTMVSPTLQVKAREAATQVRIQGHRCSSP